MTCWRRLRDWQAAGVWERLHRVLLDRLGRANAIDWRARSLDSASVPAKRGARQTGPNPTDRGKPGTKRHVVVDASGIPLALALTPGQPPRQPHARGGARRRAADPAARAAGRAGARPSSTPTRATTSPAAAGPAARRGIVPRIARRGVDSRERLGRHRWVVERTLAWLDRFRRLAVRYERRADICEAFHHLAAGPHLLHRRLIARAGADLEDHMLWRGAEQVGHQGAR